MADSNKNNVTFQLEGNLLITESSVKISTDNIQNKVLTDIKNASVLLYNEHSTKIERITCDIESGVLTTLKRWLNEDQDPVENQELVKDWRVWTYGSITTFTNNIPDRNNDWLQAPDKKIFWWSKDSYLYGDGNWEIFIKDKNNPETSLSEILAKWGADSKVRVSENDTNSSFLSTKLTLADNLSKAIKSPSWDEKMELNINFNGSWFVNDFVSWQAWVNKSVKTWSDWKINKNLIPIAPVEFLSVDWIFAEKITKWQPVRKGLGNVAAANIQTDAYNDWQNMITNLDDRSSLIQYYKPTENLVVNSFSFIVNSWSSASKITTMIFKDYNWNILASVKQTYWNIWRRALIFTLPKTVYVEKWKIYTIMFSCDADLNNNFYRNSVPQTAYWLWKSLYIGSYKTSEGEALQMKINGTSPLNEDSSKYYKALASDIKYRAEWITLDDYNIDDSWKILLNWVGKGYSNLIPGEIYNLWVDWSLVSDKTIKPYIKIWQAITDTQLKIGIVNDDIPNNYNFVWAVIWSWTSFNLQVPEGVSRIIIEPLLSSSSYQVFNQTILIKWLINKTWYVTTNSFWPSIIWVDDLIKITNNASWVYVKAYFFKK